MMNIKPVDLLHVSGEAGNATRPLEERVSIAPASKPSGKGRGLHHGSLALLDQGIVSGANFATVVIIQRVAGTSELGIYAVANSLLMLVAGIQIALIANPLTVFLPRRSGQERRQLLGSMLVQHAIFVPVVVVASLCVYFVLRRIGSEVSALALVSVVAISGLLLRDFARRISFALLNFHHATALDSCAMAVRFAGFAACLKFSSLSAVSALFVVGFADLVVSACWFGLHRKSFEFCTNQFPTDCRESWDFGRWAVLSQSMYLGQLHAVNWLIAAFCGTTATGIYSMCASVVQLAGPLIQGAGNAIGPILASAYADSGKDRLESIANRAAFVLLAASTAYLVVIWLASDHLLELLFDEANVAAYWPIVVLLSLGMAANMVGLPAAKSIGVLEKPNWNFILNAVGFFVTLAVASVAAANGNLNGAAWGVSCGFVSAFLLRWIVYQRLLWVHKGPAV